MDGITVLITGAGAPGIAGTLYSLKNNEDGRKIRTIGTDILDNVSGRYLCDAFHVIPKPGKEYLDALHHICEKESVSVVLPQNTAELSILSENQDRFAATGTIIAVSDSKSITMSNDKAVLMEAAKKAGISVAGFTLVETFGDLEESAKRFGWPHDPVVIKPPVSNGMRGFRIIEENPDLKNRFYTEKPDNSRITMNDLKRIIGESFSPLLVMEYLPGDEYSVDVLNAGSVTVIPRKRDSIRSGITFSGTVLDNGDIIENTIKLVELTGLSYAFGFQFKMSDSGKPCLLESNPRIQGTMVLSTIAGANIIYGAVKHALGETVPEYHIEWGTRLLRYWGGIGINSKEEKFSLL